MKVCEIIEELYQQFLAKTAGTIIAFTCTHTVLTFPLYTAVDSGGVFSAAANLSRVRAELTLEANKR